MVNKERSAMSATAPREKAFLLARPEQRVLEAIARRLPARVRRAERPRYGYYLDHLADAVATALVGLGLGLSAYMHLAIGLALVIAYLALSINTYLETQALGSFK